MLLTSDDNLCLKVLYTYIYPLLADEIFDNKLLSRDYYSHYEQSYLSKFY